MFPTSCLNTALPSYWQKLRQDKEWLQKLNQFLSLTFVEEKDRAAFDSIAPIELEPSLYSTFNIIRMFKELGINIESRDRIASFINSLRNPSGAYLDSFRYSNHKSNETTEAITILTELSLQPENVEATTEYLLSLKYNDGTFLQSTDGISSPENDRLYRIVKGTQSAIESLIMLGQREKIPEETINVIKEEIATLLNKNDDISFIESGSIIGAIKTLTLIDPALVSDKTKEFVRYLIEKLRQIPDVSDIGYPGRVIYLLDVAKSLGLSEAKDENIYKSIRIYLEKYIFPLQNLSGGFGPSETIDPLTTSQVVILTKRLGIEYPNLDKLLLNINNHWVGKGWKTFDIFSLGSVNWVFTYYGIGISEFTGFKYDKQKILKFMDDCLAGIPPNEYEIISLKELYYAINTIKEINGRFTKEEINNARELCLKLSKELIMASETEVDPIFTYALPISRMVGFTLPVEVLDKISKLGRAFKEEMLSGKKALIPNYLLLYWQSQETNSSLTKYDVLQELQKLYDAESGGYTSPKIKALPASPEEAANWTPEYIASPELFQTYCALQLLSDIGGELPDKGKTVDFVLSCKQEYGFKRAPDWNATTIIETTFAGIMSLKILSSVN